MRICEDVGLSYCVSKFGVIRYAFSMPRATTHNGMVSGVGYKQLSYKTIHRTIVPCLVRTHLSLADRENEIFFH